MGKPHGHWVSKLSTFESGREPSDKFAVSVTVTPPCDQYNINLTSMSGNNRCMEPLVYDF